MANQKRPIFVAVALALWTGCGGSEPSQGSSGPAVVTAPECDQYEFLVAFKRSNITTRTEIICTRQIDPSRQLWQEFTEYSNGQTTVSYWANARAVRVEGSAPDCIKAQFNEPIPRSPLLPSECVRTPIAHQ